MPASEKPFRLQPLLRRLLSGSCLACLVLSSGAPPALAMEEAWLAQRGFQRGSRAGQRAPGQRPMARPAGPMTRPAPRPGLGGGGGMVTRPAPGFDRGNRRPAGGWVNTVPPTRPRPMPGQVTRPVLPQAPGVNRPGGNRPGGNRPGGNRPGANRPDWNRPGGNRPGWNRPGWNRPNWVINRPVNISVVNARPGWWGNGWVSARPWRYGWYTGNPGAWGWWGGSSLAWGISSLASAAIIASAINNAVQNNEPTIPVTDSPYQLLVGSVAAVGDHDVSFSFLFEGSAYQASADCRDGLLNNRSPENPEEAQLLNAACQVAYASF